MTADIATLALSAAAIGVLHTAMGPDHYLPFIVLAVARRWSRVQTALITAACGIAHVGSSVVLGAIGYAVGLGLKRLQWIDAVRGNVAAWCLVIFGAVYAAVSLWKLRAGKDPGHTHLGCGRLHSGDHIHDGTTGQEIPLTPWILFAIFVFGPCEVLIPLLLYPASTSGLGSALIVGAAFAATTIGTMLAIVLLAIRGLKKIQLGWLGRYGHPLAGAAIGGSGLAILCLGL
jgi:nickel/cobalt transporter (NicO) family protein